MSFDGSLAGWLQEQSAQISVEQALIITYKAAHALQRFHDQQGIYQDINPSNFLIHIDGEDWNAERFDLRLADPNPARRASVGYATYGRSYRYPANSLLTYMAPEQWVGHTVPATDQYALAILAYELLTGQPPFQAPPAQLLDLHTNVQPSAPSTLNPRVSRAIDAVILTALAKRPEDRFPSVSAFARALEQAVHRPEPQFTGITGMSTIGTDGSLRATLLINPAEAATGTLRTITLPQGRRITVAVPPGAYDGQLIRLEGFGDPSPMGGSTGAVLLSIAVSPTETNLPLATPTQHNRTNTISRSFTLSRPTLMATTVYNKVADLSPARKIGLLASLILILLLGSVGLFSLLQTTARVPIPYPPNSGSLALNDLLHDNSAGYNWPVGTSSNGGMCQFMQNAYHVSTTQPNDLHYCIAGTPQFRNFAYEVRMTIIKGDGGGLIFRADGANSKFYYFRIGRDGSYGLYLYIDSVGTHAQTLVSGMTPAIRTGLNIPNLLAVVARDASLDLYVNNQHIANVSNNTYDNGQIGVAAAYTTEPTEVVFSDAKVWSL